ncbi:serine hydrolase [Levilactobacillus suantsaii]|uniref:serine hydrolase n=1 Tax=Levilactobacillus suantsaii TaxID=2292255 RepID=UPI0038991E53
MVIVKKVMLIAAAALVTWGLLPIGESHASSYFRIVRTEKTDYNARFVSQPRRNDGIYYYGPYNTRRSATTRDASGKNWQHRFVRVSQIATLSNGVKFVKFSWYGKTIGWVDQAALQKFSRTDNARVLLENAHFEGRAMIFNHYATGASLISVGYADQPSKSANSAATLYPLASLQKVITGAIIEQLTSEHRLAMTEKLSRFFPTIKDSENITIRQLLDQRSGIKMDETTPNTVLTTQDAQLNYTLTQLTSTGAGRYNYTNANYTLLAAIASKVTGESYNTLIQKRIIRPLNLTDTHAWDQLPTSQLTASGYSYANGQDYRSNGVSRELVSSLLGAGNYYSTPEDYYAIQKGLRNGKILTRDQYLDLANHYQHDYDGGLYHYSNGIKRVHGTLGTSGYDTVYYGTEGNKYGAILFANQSPQHSINTLARTLYDLAYYYNEN